MLADTWTCRVCEAANLLSAEVCAACGCPRAASEQEVERRICAHEPKPMNRRPISRVAAVVAAGAWLAVALLAASRERMALIDVATWLVGIYLLRYLVKRWSDQPASLGAYRADESVAHGIRMTVDVAAIFALLGLAYSIVSGPAGAL
jgi:hypothetical protein